MSAVTGPAPTNVNTVFPKFEAASSRYQSAASQLTTTNELPWAALVKGAQGDVNQAVNLLKPLAADNDPFVSRSVSASLASAGEASAMLGALSGPTGPSIRVEDIVRKIQGADAALWME